MAQAIPLVLRSAQKWVLVLLPFIILAIILVLIVSLLANTTGATETVITPTGEVTPVVTTEAK